MDPVKVSRALRGARAIKFIGSPMTRLAGTPIITWSWSVNPPIKVGDIVTMKHGNPCPGVVTKKVPSPFSKHWNIPDDNEFCRISWLDGERGTERVDDLAVISTC